VRDLARADPDTSLDEFLLPIIHAFESRRVDETLAAMQAGEGELAVVFDEFGAVEGLLTAEDIVEELVGEILDVGERRRVVPLPDGGVRARGIATVGAVNDALDGPALPGDPATTVAGLLVDALGRPPERGERIEFDGALVSVETVEDNRVRRVVVERRTDEDGRTGGDGDRDEARANERPPGNGDGNVDGKGKEDGDGGADPDSG
jgi:CBS domain containing-hemolysin-like protein